MLLKNAIKQLVRTPTRSLLFMLLVMLCSLFMTAGISLYSSSVQNIAAAESRFRTIGTIEQKHDSMVVGEFWNFVTLEWMSYEEPTYTHIVNAARLSEIPCIQPPEKREFYLAYVPHLNPAIYDRDINEVSGVRALNQMTIEFVPRETASVVEPHWVDITGYWYEHFSARSIRPPSEELFCMISPTLISGEETIILEAGKKYIANIIFAQNTPEQSEAWGNERRMVVDDYLMGQVSISDMDYSKFAPVVAEVTEDFESTEMGRAFAMQVEVMDRWDSTILVQPVADHNLLLPFYNKDAKLVQGREITREEYDSKAMVCMIPDKLAHFAGLSIGDSIELPLYEVNRQSSPVQVLSDRYGVPPVITQEDGSLSKVFDTPTYQIVGTYIYFSETEAPSGYELAPNEIIVPSGTAKNTDTAFAPMNGPMLGCTTSFEIANGSSEQFMTELGNLGLTNLEVRFYDGGYTSVMKGLLATKRTALILTAISVVCCVGISLLYVFMQVSRRRAEAGIERSLGFTQMQSMASLYLTTMPVAALGATLGSVAGGVLSGQLNSLIQEMAGQQLFDPLFGTQVNAADKAVSFAMTNGLGLLPAIASAALVLLIVLILTAMLGRGVVRLTPMQLLSTKEQ